MSDLCPACDQLTDAGRWCIHCGTYIPTYEEMFDATRVFASRNLTPEALRKYQTELGLRVADIGTGQECTTRKKPFSLYYYEPIDEQQKPDRNGKILDEVFANNIKRFHLESMGPGQWWMCLEWADGISLDIWMGVVNPRAKSYAMTEENWEENP